MRETKFSTKLLAAVSYLSVLFVVPLVLVEEDDTFTAYHIRHGFMLFIVTILANVLFVFLDIITYGYTSMYLGRLFNIAVVVASIYGMVSALRGKTYRILGISNLLEVFPI